MNIPVNKKVKDLENTLETVHSELNVTYSRINRLQKRLETQYKKKLDILKIMEKAEKHGDNKEFLKGFIELLQTPVI